jgi:hypothetical protein
MKTPLTLQQTGLAPIHNKTRIEPASGSGRITGTEKFQAHMSANFSNPILDRPGP